MRLINSANLFEITHLTPRKSKELKKRKRTDVEGRGKSSALNFRRKNRKR